MTDLLQPNVKVRSEPLTYRQDAPASYYQDFMLKGRIPGAEDRLRRHTQEMDVLAKAREAAERRRFDESGLEYRVEPNTTQGTGGYFAPPLWLNELFAPGRHAQRVIADLIPAHFPLPRGASSVNVPIISTGAQVLPVLDDAGLPDQDIVDAQGSSAVVALAGFVDVALQLLEQSPPGAHLDWAFFQELTRTYDADLEAQLAYGLGTTSGNKQILGLGNVTSNVPITFTSASPTGALMYPYLGQAVAQLGDGRELPPEVFVMRTARWGWLTTQESTAGLPFGLPSPFFMGNDKNTPDPVSGLLGFPVFLDDAIPATLGAGVNQDIILCMRPTDLIFLEGNPVTATMLVPGSGNLSARLLYRNYAACITNRYPSGIASIQGTGMVVQVNF